MEPRLINYGFSPKVIEPFGSGQNHVMICGEAPGEEEDRNGVPFFPYAQAGSLLERVLRRCGVSRDQFTITNVVWQRPPNNYLEGAPWEQEAVESYREPLDQLIRARKPRVIIALGNSPLKRFTGYGGQGATITSVSGYVLGCTDHDCWVLPGPHPSWIMRGKQDYTGFLIWIIKRALSIAQSGFTREPVRYITSPSPEDALEFEREYLGSGLPLAFDIETPESDKIDEEEVEEGIGGISSHILRASFSFQERHAISMVWQEPYISVMKRLLATGGPKRVWNHSFDVPRLIFNGAPINGRIYDFMDLWKHLQPTLRRSLGFVAPFYNWDGDPWKHLSWTDPAFYSCADADATTRISNGVTRDLKSINLWDTLERHVVDLTDVLENMKRNGLPVDAEALESMRIDLTAKKEEREAHLQTIAPIAIRPLHPKAGYVRPPKDTVGMIQKEFTDKAGEKVIRWVRVEPFNPGSPKQIAAYCKLKGYRLGTNRKTKKETTDEDTLSKLVKRHKDPVLGTTLEYRKLDKVLGTYINGWTPSSDGCVHPTPGFWGAMFRISWRRPNIGATIQDKDEEQIAAGFRKCVAAPPGHSLVESDWKGMEAKLVGYFAGDKDYQRLADLGVHDYFLSHILVRDKVISSPADLGWSDGDLIEFFGDLKARYPKRRDDAKHCIHGISYGMTEYLMSEAYGMTRKEAATLINFFFALFPKIHKWQEDTIQQASKMARLVNPFGYQMWFWDVHRWDSRKKGYIYGTDAKSAIAYLPRDTGAAMLREALLKLRCLADPSVRMLRASNHDSILSLVPDDRVDEIAALQKSVMEEPVPQLGGLTIGVEVKVGKTWHESSLKKWKGIISSAPVSSISLPCES